MADVHIIDPLPTQPDGVLLGSTTTKKFAFHGATPVAQRASANQTALPTQEIEGADGDAPTKAEYATAVARINALTVLVNELRAALVEKGLIKGSAST